MKKKTVAMIGIIIIVIILTISVYFIIIRCDKFPKNFEIDEVVIKCKQNTMLGGFHIIIYGNGAAFFLDERYNEDICWKDNETNDYFCFDARYGKLSNDTIQNLIDAFEKSGFYCLNNYYNDTTGRTECNYDYINITINNETKIVRDECQNAPSSFRNLFNQILKSVQKLPKVNENEIEIFSNEISKLDIPYLNENYVLYCLNSTIKKT